MIIIVFVFLTADDSPNYRSGQGTGTGAIHRTVSDIIIGDGSNDRPGTDSDKSSGVLPTHALGRRAAWKGTVKLTDSAQGSSGNGRPRPDLRDTRHLIPDPERACSVQSVVNRPKRVTAHVEEIQHEAVD